MREQAEVMDVATGASLLSEMGIKTRDTLIRGAAFLLKLGWAYLAVCYGIPVPTIRKMEERNP